MTRSLLILGGGGHGRVVAEAAVECGYSRVSFLDDAGDSNRIGEIPVLGPLDMIAELSNEWQDVIVGVGENSLRLRLFRRVKELARRTPNIIHPSATVSRSARLGEGVFVAAGAIIGVGAFIGDAAIINTGARIDHDCRIGAGCHIAPGATLSGNVQVGEGAWLGTGCAVRQGIHIGERSVIGVGAAVVTDVPGGHIYAGVPARPLNHKNEDGLRA